ncbi:hypothetical protein PIB30_078334, partial [Stylosanthes scabra]|nr:hypothetical protein [Stylosanthes scabra]
MTEMKGFQSFEKGGKKSEPLLLAVALPGAKEEQLVHGVEEKMVVFGLRGVK